MDCSGPVLGCYGVLFGDLLQHVPTLLLTH